MVADRYEIRGIIGKGGMGEVYLVLDRTTGKDVALKTLHSKYGTSRHAIARFVREVKLARQLNHPGIVKIYDAQKWENTLFYTMEYLPGKSLRRWLQQRQRLDFGPTVRVLCLVASALDHAHRITTHRDLSPENIMILPDGSIRVFDFGLAKLDDQFKNLTAVGANLGKLKYMAPEQELNAANVDHRADLYSLGVMFFEMLTGRAPLPGQRITDFRPELPQEADLFLVKALARNPEERFSSAREFHDALLNLYKLYKSREEGRPIPVPEMAAVSPSAASPYEEERPGALARAMAFVMSVPRSLAGAIDPGVFTRMKASVARLLHRGGN